MTRCWKGVWACVCSPTFKKVDMKINPQNKQQQYIFKMSNEIFNKLKFLFLSFDYGCLCVFCECVDEIADNQWRNKNQSCELKSNFISLTWSHHITKLDICLSRFFFIANFRLCFRCAYSEQYVCALIIPTVHGILNLFCWSFFLV